MSNAYQCDSCGAFQAGQPPYSLWLGESRRGRAEGFEVDPENAEEKDLCSRCYRLLVERVEEGFDIEDG